MHYYVIYKGTGRLHFKIATYCKIQKISNFGDNGLGNFRDKG